MRAFYNKIFIKELMAAKMLYGKNVGILADEWKKMRGLNCGLLNMFGSWLSNEFDIYLV